MRFVASRAKIKTTTVRLPQKIYEQAKSIVEHQAKGASAPYLSLNDFIVTAVSAYLKLYQRKQIDAAFAGMAEDADYQEEAKLMAGEFEASDWEALRLEERELQGEPFS
jgi:hypothetical protein